jgi:hypothetical protein
VPDLEVTLPDGNPSCPEADFALIAASIGLRAEGMVFFEAIVAILIQLVDIVLWANPLSISVASFSAKF